MARVTTAEELGKALRDGVSTIEIEGDLAQKTIRVRATGNVAWAIALGAIAVAVIATLAAIKIPDRKGKVISGAVGFAAAPVAVSVLGVSVATTAIAVAVAAGGIGALTKIRNYREVKRGDGLLVLQKN